jgi:DegV family protein with EDD domain
MQEIPGADIRIFDSLTAATPISALALDILKKADEGASMDELEAFINGAIARTETCFSVNTLEYLQKGGRIGAVGALLGSLLGIRPVITLDKEGKLVVAAKCRTRSKVLNTMLEISSSHGELERICIAHEGAEKDAEYLYGEMTKRYPGVPVLMTGIGAVLATHLGPGCIGLFVRTKE